MRGKVVENIDKKANVRITPAYAGKSFDNEDLSMRSWDHPRLCGEKGNNYRFRFLGEGSPPPMRGKVKR